MVQLPVLDETKKTEIAKLALERYGTLSTSICTWLIAYGVSLAALFITQSSAFAGFSPRARLLAIVPAFFGVGACRKRSSEGDACRAERRRGALGRFQLARRALFLFSIRCLRR